MHLKLYQIEDKEEFVYPDTWELKPGDVGFNAEAHTHMLAGGVMDTAHPMDEDTEAKAENEVR